MEVNYPAIDAKKQKLGEQCKLDEGGDRIGNLPEGILLHILSFLPTKDAVKTSILSKTWQYLWMLVPDINLNFEDVDGDEDKRKLFMNFVERVLILRDNIQKFSLSCNVFLDASRINAWIFAAVRRKVQGLDLCLNFVYESSLLPCSLFTCESLEVLELDMPHDLMLPSVICFSSLKIMTLKHVTFWDDHSPGRLFSNCPVLEKLTLDDCDWTNVNSVSISAPMLRNLTIFESSEDGFDCKVVINVTSLKSFNFSGHLAEYCFVYEPPLLPCSLFTCDSLEVLELDTFLPLMLPSVICFSSLKIMTLKHVPFYDDNSPAQLLSGCPVLEKLTLDECNWEFVESVCISAPMLRSLAIFECPYDDYNCKVVIDATSLKSFDYGGGLKNDYCLNNLSSLVDACINVYKRSYTKEQGRHREVAERTHKLLRGLHNARKLILSYEIFEVLNYAEELLAHLPMFYNLTFLKLTSWSVDFACGALMQLLQNSPSLNTMKCEEEISLTLYGEKDDWILDPVPQCFLENLKTIEICTFYGTQKEIDVIKNLLKTATSLERMCLVFVGGLKEEYEYIKQLGMLPSERLKCVCIHDDPEKGS